MQKFKLFKLLIVVLSLLIVSQAILAVVLLTASNDETMFEPFTIVIDAGHGGIDSGVVGKGGSVESKLNLLYAKQLQQLLVTRGFTVVLTRSNDDGLYGLPTTGFKMRDMTKRREIINASHADMVISLHMNKFSDSRRSGPQVFYQQGDVDSQQLAQSVQQCLNEFTSNSHSCLSGDFYICDNGGTPSVIVECGFLSNVEEEQKLASETYRNELAEVIMRGALLYLYSR